MYAALGFQGKASGGLQLAWGRSVARFILYYLFAPLLHVTLEKEVPAPKGLTIFNFGGDRERLSSRVDPDLSPPGRHKPGSLSFDFEIPRHFPSVTSSSVV